MVYMACCTCVSNNIHDLFYISHDCFDYVSRWQYIYIYILHAYLREIRVPALSFKHSLVSSNFISGVKYYKELYLGNLTLTKIQLNIRVEEINLFDLTHLASLFFRAHGESWMRTCFPNLQSKIHKANYLLPELFWGKSGI